MGVARIEGTQPDPRPRPAGARRGGFTLVELCVVLVILAAVAGLAIQVGASATADAARSATAAQLTTLRQAMLGLADGAGLPAYRRDCRGLPLVVADLLRRRTAPLPLPVEPFDPATGFGWRGPYLLVPRGIYVPDPTRGFFDRYGQLDDPAVLDAWGNPIVLQYADLDGDEDPPHAEDEVRHVRLVSAGENGRIDTPFDGAEPRLPPITPDNDDLVLYLHVADLRRRVP